jgi:hypothetical protein
MKPIAKPQKNLVMGRRNFLSSAAALGVGAGLSAPATISNAAATEISEISLRDQDLPFIGTEETFSTHELMVLNDRLFLEDTGAEIGPRRIGVMDEAGINVQILSAHTPGLQNVPDQEGIDFAYRLNKMLVDGPMATYPGRSQAFARLCHIFVLRIHGSEGTGSCYAAWTAFCHSVNAASRKVRSVHLERRWRWKLKQLKTAACVERNRCVDPGRLKPIHNRSRRRTG